MIIEDRYGSFWNHILGEQEVIFNYNKYIIVCGYTGYITEYQIYIRLYSIKNDISQLIMGDFLAALKHPQHISYIGDIIKRTKPDLYFKCINFGERFERLRAFS